MSPIAQQITNKTMADRTRHQSASAFIQQIQQADQAMDNAPPPPYTDADSDAEDYEQQQQQQQPQHKLTINADHKITGQGNLVSVNPSILADATKFSAILLKTIAVLNAAASTTNGEGDSQMRRPLCVDLTINCGVHVMGSRNVVGNIELKRKAPVPTSEGSPTAAEMADIGAEGAAVVGGAKRKADGDDEVSPLEAFSVV
jgi:hypothetical protein